MLFWLIIIPILIAFIGYLSTNKKMFIFIGLTQLGLFIFSIYLLIHIHLNGPLIESLGHYPTSIGIRLVADHISALFVVLTCFLFTIVHFFNYHKAYMNKLFLFLFLILQGLTTAIFLSNDLFNLYALIEVATLVVSILIMFKKDRRSIYDGMVYLLTNLVSMTFFLLGIGYMYKLFGTLDLTIIKATMPMVQDPHILILPYSLLLTGVGLKSALMPLFSWLPKAHSTPSAPSIVSAILSGLYVKSGLFLFIRIQDTFSPQINTDYLFLIIGFLTAVIGFILALSQTDIKLILAYHTVSQIGLIVFGLSLDSIYSYYGAIYHILNHAVFKTTLFLTAGIVIDTYGTRDIRQIRGVMKRIPFVGIIIIVAILGITGAPLFNGSISKYLIHKGTGYSRYLVYALLFINLGTIISFVKYTQILFGVHIKDVTIRWNQKITIGLLAFITFIGGILGQFFIQYFFFLDFHLDGHVLLEKLLIYLISLISAYLFYRYLYPRISFFKTIQALELSFNTIVFSIVFFFSFLLIYLTLSI